jgi:hypothetical protein
MGISEGKNSKRGPSGYNAHEVSLYLYMHFSCFCQSKLYQLTYCIVYAEAGMGSENRLGVVIVFDGCLYQGTYL